MKCSTGRECGFNGRKRVSNVKTNAGWNDSFWVIANLQAYVDGGDDCFLKEVPVSEGSEYNTYEADHFIDDSTLYDTEDMANSVLHCFHLPNRVYGVMRVVKANNIVIDPDGYYTEEAK